MKFCPTCGAPVGAPAPQPVQSKQAGDFPEKVAELDNTPDTTAEMNPNDINNN